MRTWQYLLFFYFGLHTLHAQTGSIRLCTVMPLYRGLGEDTLEVNLKGRLNTRVYLKPDSLGCVNIHKLPYGEYRIMVKNTNYKSDPVNNVMVEDSKPVSVNCRMTDAIELIELRVTGYFPPLEKVPVIRNSGQLKKEEVPRDTSRVYASQKVLEEYALLKKGISIPDSARVKQYAEMNLWRKNTEQMILYPQRAINVGEQGKVYMGFTTDEKGYIKDFKLLRGHDPYLSLEVARVLKMASGFRLVSDSEWETPLPENTFRPTTFLLSVNFKLE